MGVFCQNSSATSILALKSCETLKRMTNRVMNSLFVSVPLVFLTEQIGKVVEKKKSDDEAARSVMTENIRCKRFKWRLEGQRVKTDSL